MYFAAMAQYLAPQYSSTNLVAHENKKTIPALPVQDIEKSMDFYTTKLGFTVCNNDDGFCILIRDEVEIHLWKSGDETWKSKGASLAANPICSGAESLLACTASCRIEVQGIDELFEEYK